jgi:pyruvate-ferredoxin/flavodoxin oxidoreductase
LTSFTASSLRRLAGLFRRGAEDAPLSPGVAVVLDGLSAVAFTEASFGEGAGLAAGYPASIAARVWSRRSSGREGNALGQALGSIDSESARGALAAAIGMASSGERAVAFCSGPDLATAGDLLTHAAGQHLPLVVHLACRAGSGHAQALGSGHEAFVAARESGFLQFFARNVQEAVDLALIARRVAERALVPALVAMDGEQTATAVQEVRLPDEALVRAFLGEPSSQIETPTEAQRLIFGETRRLVPRLFDLERPMLLSPLQGPESWALGSAGARPFFDDHVPAILAEAFDLFGARTGRRLSSLVEHRLDDAEIKLVAQGSAVETAVALADWARSARHLKVGVLGIRCLRPFPGAGLAAALAGTGVVGVLGREGPAHGAGGARAAEMRTALQRGRDNARFGDRTWPGYPSLAEKQIPRLVSVPYGLGGFALRAVDLAALLEELGAPKRSRIYLGLDSHASDGADPKRQVLADALRRSYPDLEHLGLRGRGDAPGRCAPRYT